MHYNTPQNPNGVNASNAAQSNHKVVSSFTSLASYPSNIYVYGLNSDERILLFIREHKITLLFNILIYSITLFVPSFLHWSLVIINRTVLNNSLNLGNFFDSKYWFAIILTWIAFTLRGYYNIFFKWYYNINILTNHRFLDIDLINIFKNRVEETSLLSIEDAKDVQTGLIQSIFHMGNLEIFTASGETVFSLENLSQSSRVRDFIMDVVVAEKKKYGN